MSERGRVMLCNAWLYDEKEFPLDDCIYIVAENKESIEKEMTRQEMDQYKFLIFVNDTHYFREFEMPSFPVLFLKGWKNHSKSRVIDFDMINYALKNKVQVLQYKGVSEGEFSHLLQEGTSVMVAKFHGNTGQGNRAVDSIRFHPEIDKDNPEFLKGY